MINLYEINDIQTITQEYNSIQDMPEEIEDIPSKLQKGVELLFAFAFNKNLLANEEEKKLLCEMEIDLMERINDLQFKMNKYQNLEVSSNDNDRMSNRRNKNNNRRDM
ncbi:hypothetical protein TRFO_11042 [Tritrichomonas foetus]|uniref:Uncharacterized protein n=1 Tax=Tritrichomonas foetus TaxID=1144522 RepID=A0A1J4J5Z0_9EUKA|nr:hypothetical protein TRFO_11042 [Tritrichomonas foetus]|eukprot:OHS94646.1 hypothetical protein TRFO_11042 [Tritrichomonas foetus]